MDPEYAKSVIAKDADRINVVKSKLENELVKLLPTRSEFAGDEQNQVAQVIAQFQ